VCTTHKTVKAYRLMLSFELPNCRQFTPSFWHKLIESRDTATLTVTMHYVVMHVATPMQQLVSSPPCPPPPHPCAASRQSCAGRMTKWSIMLLSSMRPLLSDTS
jgi:hypothetical protein